MWFGTHAGASRYDGKSFTSFTEKDGSHGMGCNFLVDRKGNLWAGTNHGVFRFDGMSFFAFPLPKPEIDTMYHKWEIGKIWSLIQDKKGNWWFGRDGLGACKFDGKTFTLFTQKDGLCSNNVSNIIEDQQGNIWFASLSSDFPTKRKTGGLSRFDGEQFTQFRDIEGLNNSDIYTLFNDKKGHVWIGAIGLGAYRYDGQTFTLFKQTDRNDLIKNFGIQSISEDKQGTL